MSNDEKLCDRPDCPACQLESALKAMKADGIEPHQLINGCVAIIAGLYEDSHEIGAVRAFPVGDRKPRTMH